MITQNNINHKPTKKMLTNILPLLLLLSLLTPTTPKLYQVVSMTRHGARYHVNDFGDGNDTKPLWGELTAVGMRQHQKLGQLFRAEYIEYLGFLGSGYNGTQMEVYSTAFNRTMISIQSQLNGVYPLGTGPRLTYVDRSLHIPPYSNKSDIEQQNYALPKAHQPIKIKQSQKIMLSDCPNFSKYQKNNFDFNSDLVKQMNITYYPFFKRMAPMFNFSLSTVSLYTMLRVMDVVNVDRYLGRPLPQGLTDDDIANLFHLSNWYFYIAMSGNNTAMFNSGKIAKVLSVFDMRTRIPDTYALKWTFLSGHDSDLIALHLGLNLSSAQCIEQKWRKNTTTAVNCQDGANYFAANLLFQLHSDDGGKNFYVKIRSNGRYVKPCGKNSTQCDYAEWKNLVKKNVVSNVEELCGKKIVNEDNQNQDWSEPIDINSELQQIDPLIVTE